MWRGNWEASDSYREKSLWAIPTLFGCACSHPTPYNLLQVHQHGAARTHFSTLSSISVATSSRRPREIVTPGIIRMQAEMKSEKNQQRDSVKEQESRLGKLARCLVPPENTVIPHSHPQIPTGIPSPPWKNLSFPPLWWRHLVEAHSHRCWIFLWSW